MGARRCTHQLRASERQRPSGNHRFPQGRLAHTANFTANITAPPKVSPERALEPRTTLPRIGGQSQGGKDAAPSVSAGSFAVRRGGVAPFGRRYAGEREARRPVRVGRAWWDRPTARQWEVVAICCQAVVDLSTRYAEAAARMAGAPADGAGRAELERVAAVCRRAPGLLARTFHEAL